MNRNTLLGLFAAAVVAIVAVMWVEHTQRPLSDGDDAETSALLLPDLHPHLNDVDKIVVKGAGDKVIATLARGKDGWSLAEKGGYVVDTARVRELLLKLADAKRIEQKTSNKEKYATLGVEDIAANDAKGVEVDIDGAGAPIRLIVGMANTRGGTFVRHASEAETWLASATLTVSKGPADWLLKDIADIGVDRIASVVVTHADGSNLRVFKSAGSDANYTVADLPKGAGDDSSFEATALAGALAQLRFDDVVATKDASPGDKPIKARFATFDGVVVDATLWEKDGKDYAQFEATLDAVVAEKSIADDQARAKSDFDVQSAAAAAAKTANDTKNTEVADTPIKSLAVSDPARDRESRTAALNKEIAALNARFDDWTFVLPAYKYAAINKSLADFRKPADDRNGSANPADKSNAAAPSSDRKSVLPGKAKRG